VPQSRPGQRTKSAAKCRAIRKILPWSLVLEALLKSGHLPATAVEELASGAAERG
jgi:hypothetical protein